LIFDVEEAKDSLLLLLEYLLELEVAVAAMGNSLV
jgi:hypothetical protein